MKPHGATSNWLRHEDQAGVFDVLVALALTLVFLAAAALLLWPLDRLALAVSLAKGYGVLWGLTGVAVFLGSRIQGLFRVNLYDHPDAYVRSNLAVSCVLQAGWAAFAALGVHRVAPGASLRVLVVLWVVGFLSCLAAFFAVSAFYRGHVYKLISLPLALAGFVVFGVWPGAARVLFGWLFALF